MAVITCLKSLRKSQIERDLVSNDRGSWRDVMPIISGSESKSIMLSAVCPI